MALSAALSLILVIPVPAAASDSANRSSPDSQSSDNIPASILTNMRHQESLQPVVNALYERANRTPESGFASIAFEGDGLVLYWKGVLPLEMRAIVNRAGGIGAVSVREARFSLADMNAAIDRIKTAGSVGGAITNIQSIEARGDGSGLTVMRMPSDTFERVRIRAEARLSGKVISVEQALATAAVDMPVELETARAPLFAASRIDDSSPFNGGTRFRNFDAGNSACTVGFGVRKGSQTYLLSAAHCATAPDDLYDGVVGESSFSSMNTVYQENWDKDIMLINARGFYRMFDGSPTTNNYKLVHGWGYHASGEYLCQSGSTSGTICGLKTTNVSNGSYQLTDSDGDTFYVHGMITATQVDGATAARSGDSGGPVFSLMGSGVRAKGVVSGVSGSTLIFQDWADVINSFGAYPVTAP